MAVFKHSYRDPIIKYTTFPYSLFLKLIHTIYLIIYMPRYKNTNSEKNKEITKMRKNYLDIADLFQKGVSKKKSIFQKRQKILIFSLLF